MLELRSVIKALIEFILVFKFVIENLVMIYVVLQDTETISINLKAFRIDILTAIEVIFASTLLNTFTSPLPSR